LRNKAIFITKNIRNVLNTNEIAKTIHCHIGSSKFTPWTIWISIRDMTFTTPKVIANGRRYKPKTSAPYK
jgi:hypothetical protein